MRYLIIFKSTRRFWTQRVTAPLVFLVPFLRLGICISLKIFLTCFWPPWIKHFHHQWTADKRACEISIESICHLSIYLTEFWLSIISQALCYFPAQTVSTIIDLTLNKWRRERSIQEIITTIVINYTCNEPLKKRHRVQKKKKDGDYLTKKWSLRNWNFNGAAWNTVCYDVNTLLK